MKHYDLFQIDETRREDKTGENTDNTLTRYFFPEDINTGTKIQTPNVEIHKISEEKIEKSLRQPIKLRNALKQCYWDRNCTESQNHYIISVDQVLPKFNFTLQIQTEIQNYILNDFYDVHNGKLKFCFDKENRQINFTGIDIINTQSVCENFENNLVLNPKRTSNKNEIKHVFLNFFRRGVLGIKNIKNADEPSVSGVNKYPDKNSSSLGLFNYNFYFNREKTLDNSYKVNGKIYCIFPNINLELKRINKIPISRSVLSKYLVNGGRLDKLEKNEAEQLKNCDRKNGFIAMSSKHRLITLQNITESKKEILFGIWVNLSEEKINKNSINEEMLNKILFRYSAEIYEKCLNFLIMSKKIEMINSPSPDEGIFLMCLFLNGAQYFYEVRSLPNEKEKFFAEEGNNTCLSNFSNEWLIVKKNFKFENFSNFSSKNSFLPKNKLINENQVIKFDFSCQTQNKIKTAKEYFKKKYLLNMKDSNRDSRNKNHSNIPTTKGGNINPIGLKCEKTKSANSNYKDPLNEIFEEGELEKEKDYLKYDFPLSIPKKQSKISNELKSANYQTNYQQFDNLKKGIAPKPNNKTIKENSCTSGTNLNENETRLRENLLVRKNSNSHLQQNLSNKNELSNKYIPNSSQSQSIYNEENQSQTITSKGFTDNSVINNNKLPSSFHRPGNEPSNLNTIENQNSVYFNHKKHMSNDVGYHTAQNFFPNRLCSLEINKGYDVGKSIHNVKSNILSPNGTNIGNLIPKPSFDKFETISHGNESNIQNAYDIIYDQAKSIQFLQEQIVKLQTELSFVVDKLRTQDDKEKNSLICSCGGKTSNEKQNVISTGTNTSIEIQNFNAGFNNFPYENNNRSNSNSLKSNNNNINNASRPSIKNFNEIDNTANILASQNNPTLTAFKSEDDYRYENFLNENSINFPKQFLDIDTKHYDSLIKEENLNSNQTNNNTQLNLNSNYSSNAYANVIDKNYKLMREKVNNSNEIMLGNRNNKLDGGIRNFNINSDNFLIDESLNYKNSTSAKEKDKAIGYFDAGLKNFKNIIPNFNQINERANIGINSMRMNLDNIDITTTSIDPPSYRYVLKVPSVVGKSINSFAYDDQNMENVHRRKSLDTTRGNDYTINLPRIIFNESIESYEENDGE